MRAAEALCTNTTFNANTDLSRAHVVFCPENKIPPDYCIVHMVKKKTNGTGNDRHSKRTPLFFKYNATAIVNPCRELFWMYTEGDPVPTICWAKTFEPVLMFRGPACYTLWAAVNCTRSTLHENL